MIFVEQNIILYRIRHIVLLILLTGFNLSFAQKNLPLLDMNKSKFDFGVTQYMESKSQQIVLKNIGDTVLTIYRVDSILRPFSGRILYPDTLRKNDSVVYTISYAPIKAARDSQRVFLRADTRLSNSIALLIDVSLSMDRTMNDGSVKKTATNNAVTAFINSMLATPKVWDEAGVFSFAKNFYTNCNFTTDKTALRNSLPNTTYNSTAFYDGCIEAMDRLKLRKFVKVMVALTDGEDNASIYKYTDVINFAKANKIKIFTVGIGSTTQDAILRSIAISTGGEFFKGNTSKELQDIYYRIFMLLSKNVELYFDILGSCGTPKITMNCADSLNVSPGDTIEYPVHLSEVSSSGSRNHNFVLHLSFNPTMLSPLHPFSKMTNYGRFEIRGTCTGQLDSMPLINLKFLTLLGNTDCTTIRIDSLKWDDSYYPTIISKDYCDLCIKACVRGLRQIETLKQFSIFQISPNPVTNESEINFVISEEGNYQLTMYDVSGAGSSVLISKEFKPGTYSINLNASDYPSGLYYIILSSATQKCVNRLMIAK